MTGRPGGSGLRRWSERHFNTEFCENVLLPAIADLQFEQLDAAESTLSARQYVRLRGYVAFAKALALGMLLHPERGLMTEKKTRPVANVLSPGARLLAGALLLILSVPAVVTNWRLIRDHTAGGMVFGAVLLGMGAVGLLSLASGLRSMQRSTTP